MNKKNSITNLSLEEIKKVLQHFDVGNPVECKIIEGGLANTNCKLITDKGTFLLKICDEKSLQQLQKQIEVLNHFQTNGYFTAFPRSMKNYPESFVYFESEKNLRIIIFDFLPGAPKAFTDVTPIVMKELGASVAKLHLVPKFPNLPDFPMGLAEMEPFLQDIKGTNFEHHEFVTFLSKHIDRLKQIIRNPSLPKGIVHGDIFADNTMFEGEKLVAIIDFEEVCEAPYILDIAMTICGCCYPNNILDHKLMNAFVDSYEIIRPLTTLEHQFLPDFLDYSSLCIAFWRFRQFNVRVPDKSLSDKYKEMTARIQEK